METGQDTFEEQELEELKELTLKHRRGQISDLDFDEHAAWLLKGRSFPVLTSNPKNELSDENLVNPLENKKQKELSALTSCGERSKRARQSYIRKHKESKQESLVMKTFKSESSSKHKKSVTDSGSIIEERISSSISNSHISAINQSLQEAEPQQNFKPIIYSLCATIVVISTILIMLLTSKKNTQVVSIDQLTKLLTAHDQNPAMPTLFGPVTVSQCNTLCTARNGENCENACRKLSFEMFPHRISLSDNSPEILANKLEKSCLMTFKNEKKSSNDNIQAPELNFNALENFSLSELTSEYSNISAQHKKLQKGPKDNKDLEVASVSLCLRANEIISYVGSIVANSYRDHYAVAYYQLIQRAFANKNATERTTTNS